MDMNRLRHWYKPTKLGEQARELLAKNITDGFRAPLDTAHNEKGSVHSKKKTTD